MKYLKDIWETQPNYVEVWLEKDALRNIFLPILSPYQIPLVIGRGYQSLSNLKEAVVRIREQNKPTYILYFGDFDPSGLSISKDIEYKLKKLGAKINFDRIGITLEQIKQYQIPNIPTKKSDKRTPKFIQQYGNKAYELDALNPRVLQEIILKAILKHLDLDKFKEIKELEAEEKRKLAQYINKMDEVK